MLDGPRDSSNDYRPENSPPSNTFKDKDKIDKDHRSSTLTSDGAGVCALCSSGHQLERLLITCGAQQQQTRWRWRLASPWKVSAQHERAAAADTATARWRGPVGRNCGTGWRRDGAMKRRPGSS